MGKASSNKKVARAATTGGGRTSGGGRKPWLWYMALTAFVAVGAAIVVTSRSGLDPTIEKPDFNDHWHTAYGIYICDQFKPPMPQPATLIGLHTHTDGLIHVEPNVSGSTLDTGKNATIGRYASGQPGFKVSETEIEYPGDKTYKNGDKCGDKSASMQVRIWENQEDETAEEYKGDPEDIRIFDQQLVTLAFVPDGTEIPKPPSMANLANPNAGEGGQVPPIPTVPGLETPVDPTTPPSGDTSAYNGRRHTHAVSPPAREAGLSAVVLVGGEGTRLRPLTYTTPKQMLPVAGMPMIERVLGHLGEHGVDRVVLSMGYRPDALVDAYADGTCAGLPVEYAVEPEPLDTAGAIRFAATSAGLDDDFIVVNGDVITTIDITELVAFHRKRDARATIALTPVDDPSRFGVVVTDDDGRVTAFIEKPPPGEAPTNLINAGIYVLSPAVIDTIPDGRRVSIERETFPELVAAGALYALPSEGSWIDIGTPAAYLEANLALAGVGGDGTVVGDGVRIDDSAHVARSVLLDGAVVARNASVRGSIVGRRAVIGEGASIDDLTIIGDGVIVPPDATLVGVRLPEAV